jgi:hypothetical protein
LIDDGATPMQRLLALLRRHRRLVDEVACAAPNLGVDQPRVAAAVAVDAGIHDPEFYSLQPREHADGRAAAQEIPDHLFGHRAWIGAHTPVRDTVIRGEYDRHWMDDRGLDCSLHGANLSRERFEIAEGAEWFRQRVQPSVGGGTNRFVGRRNGIELHYPTLRAPAVHNRTY